MANFAALYPLPGGEQLLVVLVTEHVLGPIVQYATEVHGNVVTANVPLYVWVDGSSNGTASGNYGLTITP